GRHPLPAGSVRESRTRALATRAPWSPDVGVSGGSRVRQRNLRANPRVHGDSATRHFPDRGSNPTIASRHMTLFEVFARTEIGCARERNEDAFLVLDLQTGTSGILPKTRQRPMSPPGTVVAVCDGMGGAAAGDVASRIAL